MSCEADFIYERIEEVKVDVRLDFLEPEEIRRLIETATCCVNQKLEKLNLMFGGLNVYAYNGAILINDRYNTVPSITDVTTALGMEIHPIQCGLRGKNYVVSESLVDFIEALGGQMNFGEQYKTEEADEELKEILRKERKRYLPIDNEMRSLIKEVLANGDITITETHVFKQTYNNDYLRESELLEVRSDREAVETKIKTFLKSSLEKIKEQNLYLQNGTTEILCHRAKQMGYKVEKTVKDKQIQLVLVRNN